jgi:hypothetical protein
MPDRALRAAVAGIARRIVLQHTSWVSKSANGLRVAAAVALCCGVTSCGDSEDEGKVLESGDRYVLVGQNLDGENIAGFGYSGTVEIVGACLGINGTTVFWPHGTTIVSDDPLEIDVPGLGRLTEGDEVGEVGAEDWSPDQLPDGIDEVPSDCPSDDLIALTP